MSAAVVSMLPQPTVPGYVSGIIALDPFTIQCAECGAVAVSEKYGPATFIILSGYRFLPWRPGERLCPDCLSADAGRPVRGVPASATAGAS